MDVEAEASEILERLEALSDEKNKVGMARFKIDASRAFGVSMPVLRALAKAYSKQPELAEKLWELGFRETRILAGLVHDPQQATEAQLDLWVLDFQDWETCDQTAINLIRKTPFAWKKVTEWAEREAEFVRRAGFATLATLAVHDKKADDAQFIQALPLLERHAEDPRNFVKKAVNWALRQIGKRNAALRQAALETAERLAGSANKTARWVGSDAARELKRKTDLS